MWKKMLVPLFAAGLLVFAVMHTLGASQKPPKQPIPVEPAHSPFTQTVSGAGLVEGRSTAGKSSGTANISVGSVLPGVVKTVYVRIGQKVKQGEKLFDLDDRQQQAELDYRLANLKAADSQLAKLVRQPRPEEVPVTEAKLDEAKANLVDQTDQLKRAQQLFIGRSIGEEELVRRRQAKIAADAQVAQARASLDLLKAGAWKYDKDIAAAAVEQAKAQVQQIRTDLDRLVVTAPADGTILQVNVRPGEYVGTPPGQPLVVLSDLGEDQKQFNVRVDIDENDIPRFSEGMTAVAKLRGDPTKEFKLKFVRVEPYVVPKKALTGDNTERVDTRVLQAIYAVEPGGPTALYVGMQMYVFLDAAKP